MVVALRDGSNVPIVIYNPDAHQRQELFTIKTSSPYVEVSVLCILYQLLILLFT